MYSGSPKQDDQWTLVLRPSGRGFRLNIKQIIRYRDLLWMFVRRDFVSAYTQTILGPLWFFIQPVLTTVVFTVIFGKLAGIPTGGIPPALFYMAGIISWNYFSECLTKTSQTFIMNAALFGKVYFPRIIVPLSIVSSNIIRFGIQFLLFLAFLGYYLMKGADIHPNLWILLTPVLLIIMAFLGLAFGILVASMTTKYRDLQYLVGFGVQLGMYITPVVYPLSFVKGTYRWVVLLNPMTPLIETFKFAFLGTGEVLPLHLVYSAVFTLCLFLFSTSVFNKVEKSFMDTV